MPLILLLAAGAIGLRAQTATGVSFEISLPEGKSVWRQGEIIPVTLRISAAEPDRWAVETRKYDRIGRLNHVETFHLFPADGVTDPLAGLPGAGGGLGGLSGGFADLVTPFDHTVQLNEWVRFDAPGSYRLTISTNRVRQAPDGVDVQTANLDHRLYSATPISLTSNELTLEIVAPTPEWLANERNRAIALLETPDDRDDWYERRGEGARILRFLGDTETALEMVRRLGFGTPSPSYAFYLGILSSRDSAGILRYARQRLGAAGQAVDDRYIDMLAQLTQITREGRSIPPADEAGLEAWRAESGERYQRLIDLQKEYYEQLALALPNKQGAALARSTSALSSYATRQAEPPGWIAAIAVGLRASFLDLSPGEQRDLLTSRWFEVAGPGMAPVLKQLYEEPPELHKRELRNLALRRLYEVDPTAGRRIIIEQIRSPSDGLDRASLHVLSEDTLPEVFDVFAADLAQGGYATDHLVLRYGDASLADAAVEALRLRATAPRWGQQASPCVTPLHLFLLKVAPEAGELLFRTAIAKSIAEQPRCLDLRKQVPNEQAWSPRLELLLIELLDGPPVIAKDSSAALLGRYGSQAAKEPLWKAMEAFHQWWDGRQDDLAGPDGAEGRLLERTLISALGAATAWILEPEEMLRLKDHCISAECGNVVRQWIADGVEPLELSIRDSDAGAFSATAGHFRLGSRRALLNKVRQFPSRTRFRWLPKPAPRVGGAAGGLVGELERLLPGLR